jgi:hypothetical protein
MRTPELDTAFDIATRLRDAISAEIEGARGERHLLKSLDSDGLFGRAARRASFLAETARLERDLAVALAEIGARFGLRQVTLDCLRSQAIGRSAELADLLSDVRALAGALQEIDKLNHELARRALVVVRGYVEAFRPTARAYDRFGSRAGTPSLAVVSSKG